MATILKVRMGKVYAGILTRAYTGRMNISPVLAAAYGITAVLLTLILMGLWMLSGVARARSGVTNNPEDGAKWNKPVQAADPPSVARVLRAHANAAAVTYPFLALAAAFTLLNGNVLFAQALFAAFVVLRLLHAIAYLRSWQPARSIVFALSFFALLALAAAVAIRAFHVAAVTT